MLINLFNKKNLKNLSEENFRLKQKLQDLQKKEELFENAFYNGLDGLIAAYYKPEIHYQESRRSDSLRTNKEGKETGSFLRLDYGNEVPEEIEKVIAGIDSSFSDRLMEIIREKNLNEVEVYKKADLDRRHFSKIRSNSNYRPTKDTVILLCMSMELSFDETNDLLKRAGFAFSDSSKTDLISQYFIRKRLYDIGFYKEVLYKYGVLK